MDEYAKRIITGTTDVSQNQCAHCNLQFPGARARSTHERRCSSKNSVSTNKVNKSTVDKQVLEYNVGNEFSHQYKQGAAFVNSLKNKGNLKDRAMKKKKQKKLQKMTAEDEDFFFGSDDSIDLIDGVEFDGNNDDESMTYFTGKCDDDTNAGDDFTEDNEQTKGTSSSDEIKIEIPNEFLDMLSRDEERKHRRPAEKTMNSCPKKFKYNNSLNETQIALVDLARLLSRHKCDKIVFDEVANWTQYWTNKNPHIWRSYGQSNTWSRKKLISCLEETFQCKDQRPVDRPYEMSDGRKVSIPVFDFATNVRSILDDPNVTNVDNIMAGLDKDTWRPIVTESDHEKDIHAVIADKDSGYLYRMGIDAHVPNPDQCDPTEVVPLPVIFHIDQSHFSNHGDLAVTPVGMTLAMLDVDTIQEVDAWRMIAVVPNLSAKIGKYKDNSVGSSSKEKLQDQNNVFKIALSSFQKACDDGGIPWTSPTGKVKILKPYLYMIIGDTEGNNALCNHMKGNTPKCLVKDCKCPMEKLSSVPALCTPINYDDLAKCKGKHDEIFEMISTKGLVSMKDLWELDGDQEKEKAISFYDIENFASLLPLADRHLGVIGMTPQEILHVLEQGLFDYGLQSIHDIIGPRKTNEATKHAIDILFSDVKLFIERNSERDMKRMANRLGFFNLTKMNASERHGNFFAFTVLMHTSYGEKMLKPCFIKKGVDYNQTKETCMLLLSWARFLMDFNERYFYTDALQATYELMAMINKHLPRPRVSGDKKNPGSRGWDIVKFHVLPIMIANCLKFGCARVYHGSAGEKNHKWFVKRMGMLTQCRLESFAWQVAMNYFDYELFKLAYRSVEKHCRRERIIHEYENDKTTEGNQYYDEFEHCDEINHQEGEIDPSFARSENVDTRGQYSMVVHIEKGTNITHDIKWLDENRNILKTKPSPMIPYAIGYHHAARSREFKLRRDHQSVEVECYTQATVPCKSGDNLKSVLFRCTPDLNGREWYDFALVKFPSTREHVHDFTCAARIMGFFRYKSLEAFSFKKIEVDQLDYEQAQVTTDDTLYVILQCEEGYMTYKHIENNFLRKIKIQNTSELYIYPAGCIVGPLLAVPNIVDQKTVSKNEFIVCSGYHKWGMYFKRFSVRRGKKTKKQKSQFVKTDKYDKNYW